MSEPVFTVSRRVVVCAIALQLFGCGGGGTQLPASTAGAGGSGGGAMSTTGGGGAVTQPGTALSWGVDGFVAGDTNPYAIEGPFYSYSDCDPPSGLPCSMPDASLTGADAKPSWSVDAGKVCLKSTAVKVKGGMFAAQ